MDNARSIGVIIAFLGLMSAGCAGFLSSGERLHIQKLFEANSEAIVKAVSDDTRVIVARKFEEAGVNPQVVEELGSKSPVEWGETGILALLTAMMGRREYQAHKEKKNGGSR
jgi:hypothetical protein